MKSAKLRNCKKKITTNKFCGEALIFLVVIGVGSSGAADQLVYSHEFGQGITYCPANPQYDDWSTFRANLPESGVTSIAVKSTFDPAGGSCADPVKAQQIADALRSGGGVPGATTAPAFSVPCDGFVWRTGTCQVVGGCAQPTNNVELAVGLNQLVCTCDATDFHLRPARGDQFWGGDLGNCGVPTQSMTVVVEIAAAQITLIAAKDSFLRRGNPDRNEGANPGLRLQAAGDNRAMIGFNPGAIDGFGSLTTATLVLTIAENAGNWGRSNDRTVDAHPLLVDFAEGNGQNAGVPGAESTRGSGPGVTWNCAEDAETANQQTDCDAEWAGGDFGLATAASVLHFNGLSGEVSWDVTDDVLAGASAWLVKKTSERQPGRVSYFSREGAAAAGDPDLAPRLILEK